MKYVLTVADMLDKVLSEPLNAAEYAEIAEWEKEEIPLELVETIIRELSGSGGKPPTVRSIAKAVRAGYVNWLRDRT